MKNLFLFMLHDLFEWLIGGQGQKGRIFPSLQKGKREVGELGHNFIGAKVIYGKIYNVFEFPNVSRPVILPEGLGDFTGEVYRFSAYVAFG